MGVAQRVTEVGHDLRQRVVGDGHIRPDASEQLVLGYDRPGTLDRGVQQRESLGRELHLALVLHEPVGGGLQFEGPETVPRR